MRFCCRLKFSVAVQASRRRSSHAGVSQWGPVRASATSQPRASDQICVTKYKGLPQPGQGSPDAAMWILGSDMSKTIVGQMRRLEHHVHATCDFRPQKLETSGPWPDGSDEVVLANQNFGPRSEEMSSTDWRCHIHHERLPRAVATDVCCSCHGHRRSAGNKQWLH